MLRSASIMHTLPFNEDTWDGCQLRLPRHQIWLLEKQTRERKGALWEERGGERLNRSSITLKI